MKTLITAKQTNLLVLFYFNFFIKNFVLRFIQFRCFTSAIIYFFFIFGKYFIYDTLISNLVLLILSKLDGFILIEPLKNGFNLNNCTCLNVPLISKIAIFNEKETSHRCKIIEILNNQKVLHQLEIFINALEFDIKIAITFSSRWMEKEIFYFILFLFLCPSTH